MKIGICDDRKEDREEANRILAQSSVVKAGGHQIMCLSPDDLILDLEEGLFTYDLIVMDIEFGNEQYNGITLSKWINRSVPLCQIIYLTDFLEFAPDVYETEHCYFVLKKNMELMLPLAMEKAFRLYERDKESFFVELTSEGRKQYLQIRNIICVEKEDRKLHVYTTHGDYYSYQSMTAFARKCAGEMVRCHGSYMVNLRYVTRYDKEMITLENDMQIPIGRSYQEQTKEAYLNYWVDRI